MSRPASDQAIVVESMQRAILPLLTSLPPNLTTMIREHLSLTEDMGVNTLSRRFHRDPHSRYHSQYVQPHAASWRDDLFDAFADLQELLLDDGAPNNSKQKKTIDLRDLEADERFVASSEVVRRLIVYEDQRYAEGSYEDEEYMKFEYLGQLRKRMNRLFPREQPTLVLRCLSLHNWTPIKAIDWPCSLRVLVFNNAIAVPDSIQPTKLPTTLRVLVAASDLNLVHCPTLPEGLQALYLERLSQNWLENHPLPSSLIAVSMRHGKVGQLEPTIDSSDEQLRLSPDVFGRLEHLRSLTLEGPRFRDLALSLPPSLEHLTLDYHVASSQFVFSPSAPRLQSMTFKTIVEACLGRDRILPAGLDDVDSFRLEINVSPGWIRRDPEPTLRLFDTQFPRVRNAVELRDPQAATNLMRAHLVLSNQSSSSPLREIQKWTIGGGWTLEFKEGAGWPSRLTDLTLGPYFDGLTNLFYDPASQLPLTVERLRIQDRMNPTGLKQVFRDPMPKLREVHLGQLGSSNNIISLIGILPETVATLILDEHNSLRGQWWQLPDTVQTLELRAPFRQEDEAVFQLFSVSPSIVFRINDSDLGWMTLTLPEMHARTGYPPISREL